MSSHSKHNLHSHAKRLFRCFSDSTQLNEDDIHRIYYLDLRGILNDEKALRSFHSYLRNKHTGDPSEVKQLLDIHSRVKELIMEQRLVSDDEVEELSDLGLPYDKEKRLSRSRSVDSTRHCLVDIQEECEKEIELNSSYKQFKEALLLKVKRGYHHK
ncbi:uncharacterized protein LOC119657938 isoform X2 [Hermetia illucens]|uniref:uncharacterized protein LOC119657938 isoform X2 n=1 Tax=Hermetia illucens TaxID=343691 RepID=UPI0018CC5595|nr:uncharacterized protein LOC119657938 isoform X2 [Hermetia illucens]